MGVGVVGVGGLDGRVVGAGGGIAGSQMGQDDGVWRDGREGGNGRVQEGQMAVAWGGGVGRGWQRGRSSRCGQPGARLRGRGS